MFAPRRLLVVVMIGLGSLVDAGSASGKVAGDELYSLLPRIDSLVLAELEQTPSAGLSVAVQRGADLILAKGYGDTFDFAPGAQWKYNNSAPISMNTPGAAGALCSTTPDLLRWQRALDDNRLISAAPRRLMLTSAVLNNGEVTGYGYGLGIGELEGHPRVSHGGGGVE